MRKQLKWRRRSRDLCKPHRAGHDKRWQTDERDRLAGFDRTPRQVTALGATGPR